MVAHGLQAALDNLCAQLSFHRTIQFECRTDPDIRISDNGRATHLYYIAREAVNNAVKYARANRIEIRLAYEPKEQGAVLIHLSVQDNGCGISPYRRGTGIGLQIMEYRAKIIDAQFDIETGPGGTRVNVRLEPQTQEEDIKGSTL